MQRFSLLRWGIVRSVLLNSLWMRPKINVSLGVNSRQVNRAAEISVIIMKVEVDGFSRLVTFIKQMQDEIIWTRTGRIMEWKISWVNQQACQVILHSLDGGFFFNLLKRHILFSQGWSNKDSLPRNAAGYTPPPPHPEGCWCVCRTEIFMKKLSVQGMQCTCMCTVQFRAKISA